MHQLEENHKMMINCNLTLTLNCTVIFFHRVSLVVDPKFIALNSEDISAALHAGIGDEALTVDGVVRWLTEMVNDRMAVVR